ncbi:MAG: TonB-dependent receptor [Flavipsychrobacter sp.]|nr:TonB-dependent receptor [Flavipsychrobacter sp.]
MKKLLLTLCMLFITTCIFAQTKLISGMVTGSEGDTLIGVTIQIKGTKVGTVSDADGYYSINVPTTGVVELLFTYTGYGDQTIAVGASNTINVRLKSTNKTLDEMVVIGYQTVQRRDLTGSVSSVTSKELKDLPVNSAGEALEGRLAGVNITSNEGAPGSDVTIKVRGGNSITQDNSPLYIIDGIEVEDGLNAISPQDIASVDVLKDASATAIYGSRGANGVVIITTKRGSDTKGKAKISYNGFVGVQKLGKELSVMDPYDFVKYWYSQTRNATDSPGFARLYGTTWDTLINYKKTPTLDWQNQLFGRDAVMQTHNVALTGGNSTTQYSISLTSNNQQGIMLLSGYDRELMNLSLDHQFSKKLKISFNTRYNSTVVNGSGTSNPGSSALNFLRQTVRYRPFIYPGQTIYTYDPGYNNVTNDGSLGLVNPILLNQAQYKKATSSIFNISGHLDYNFTDQIMFRTTIGVDITNTQTNMYNDSLTSDAKLNGGGLGEALIINGSRMNVNNSNVLTYTNAKNTTSFAKKNTITVLVGEETYSNHYVTNAQEARGFAYGISPSQAFANMSLGQPARLPSSTLGYSSIDTTDHIASFFGRLNYSYDQKYLATVSFRADGSSKFQGNNQYGYFPSAALAYRISNEAFMQKLRPVLSDLKVRLSIGQSGNNRIADNLFLTQYGANSVYYLQGPSGSATPAFVSTYLANPNLKWETTTSRNLGFDASFLDGRLGFTADFYINTSDNLLLPVPISPTEGYTTQLQNIGSTRNRGMEYQANATVLKIGAFRWTANYNMSFNNNVITSLGGPNSFLVSSGWAPSFAPADYIAQVGQQVGTMSGLVFDGYYKVSDFDYNPSTRQYVLKAGVVNDAGIVGSLPQPGQIKYKDIKKDGVIDLTNDRAIIGHANPIFYGGLHQQFSYKSFDLSVFINFSYGNQVYNDNKLEFSNAYTKYSNLLASQIGAWSTIDSKTGAVLQTSSTGTQWATGVDPTTLAAANAHATGPMPQTGNAAFYPSSYAVEDGSFIRINNITLGYTLPAGLLRKVRIQNFRVYATVNNLAVITGYSGYDPEANTRRGTPLTPGVDYSTYPRSHTYLFGVNAAF